MTKPAFLMSTGLAALLVAAPAAAQTQIEWWHGLGGELGEMLEAVAESFNESQDEFQVNATYRGTYAETMTAAIAGFRSGNAPHIVQVFEVGTGTMMAAEGAIFPVYQLMEQHGREFDPDDYLEQVVSYYTDPEGNMLSFPFNSSTPIVYFNLDVFEEAGLDTENLPETWDELVDASRTIIESGAAPCGFTTAWPSWIQLENFSAWHDLPLGTQMNGFEGFDTELVFNNEHVARHWDNLRSWSEEGVFRWGGPGPGNDAPPLFYAGDCAIYMNSSAARAAVVANSDFEVGFGMLPYYDDIEGAPQNSIIGGATLWVFQGFSDEEYEGIAAFFEFVSDPEVQAQWHQDTGYLPITQAAWELSQEQGYYEENPGADISIQQMTLNEPTENSRGLRFGNMVQIRDVVSEEMEAVMTGAKSGQQAADDAVARGNQLLREFEAQVN